MRSTMATSAKPSRTGVTQRQRKMSVPAKARERATSATDPVIGRTGQTANPLVAFTELATLVEGKFRLPFHVLENIIIASHVPDQYRSIVQREVPSIVDYALCQQLFRKLNQIKEARAPLRRIARDAENLADSLQRIDPVTRILLEVSLSTSSESSRKMKTWWFQHDDGEMTYATILRGLAEVARRAGSPPKKSVSHRPRGSIQNLALHCLVSDLYSAIVELGRGELSLWYDESLGELKGTLPVVLGILRPYLPGVVPENQNLNYSMLRRPLQQFKKP